jgi:cytoskeleton protein RodZ
LDLSAETPREFGEELRRERELRDVSREQLAMAIRISIRQLDALESGRFEILPAKVFSRGFVRAIAIYLGLDSERYSAAFAAVWEGWAKSEKEKTSSDIVHSGQHVRLSKPRRAASMSALLVGGGVALAIALVTIGAVFLRGRAEHPAARPSARSRIERATVPGTGPASLALPPSIASSTVPLPPLSAPVSPPVMVPTAPVPPASTPRPASTPVAAAVLAAPPSIVPAPASAPAASGRLVLKMVFRDDCWTEVSADGRPVAAELFRKGAEKELTGSRRFVVTIGNAGAVSLWLNGAPVKFDGGAGKVVKDLVVEPPSASRSSLR